MMRIVMPAIAATALFASGPASACLYTQAPELVGAASAPFFTGRMMQAAATVEDCCVVCSAVPRMLVAVACNSVDAAETTPRTSLTVVSKDEVSEARRSARST